MLPWKRGSRVSGNYGADLIRGFQFFFSPSVKAINVIIDFRASKGRDGCIYSLSPPFRQRSDNSFKTPEEAPEPFPGGLRRQWWGASSCPGPAGTRRATRTALRPGPQQASRLSEPLGKRLGVSYHPDRRKSCFLKTYRDYPFADTWRSQRCSRLRRVPWGFSPGDPGSQSG